MGFKCQQKTLPAHSGPSMSISELSVTGLMKKDPNDEQCHLCVKQKVAFLCDNVKGSSLFLTRG